MSEEKKKMNTVSIGNYQVAKNGTTKYIKLECSPKADDKTKKLVEDLKAVLGGDVLFVNLFDAEFKEKYKIPDYAKGRINIDLDLVPEAAAPAANTPATPKAKKDEVDF